MEQLMSAPTDLVVASPTRPAGDALQAWPEPVDTPGILPHHLLRRVSSQVPLLEILHRWLYRIRPDTHSDLDKVLAAIALYSAAVPVLRALKGLALWAFTVEVTIPESDP